MVRLVVQTDTKISQENLYHISSRTFLNIFKCCIALYIYLKYIYIIFFVSWSIKNISFKIGFDTFEKVCGRTNVPLKVKRVRANVTWLLR